ncbi:MAG: hypothetical protein ACRETI_07240 [Steroidobacteraceae bacterium]
MRNILAAIVVLACSSCDDRPDTATPFAGFKISLIEAYRSIAVTPIDAGTVYINRYATGPGGPPIGAAVLVLHPGIESHTPEALDVDGDGCWDAVRYMAKKDNALVWVEDNDGDGVVDSTTPITDPPESISLPILQ